MPPKNDSGTEITVSYTHLQGAYEHVPAADRPKRGVPKFSYPWKLFVLYGLYAFAYGMRANQLVAGAGRHSSASTFILMAVLFATAYFASKRFNIGLLYRSPVVLMAVSYTHLLRDMATHAEAKVRLEEVVGELGRAIL